MRIYVGREYKRKELNNENFEIYMFSFEPVEIRQFRGGTSEAQDRYSFNRGATGSGS